MAVTGKSPEKTEKEPEEENDTDIPEAVNQEAVDSENVSEELDEEDSSDEKPTVDDAEEISIRSAGNTKSGTSGKCGPNLNYTIDSDGVLTISGTGEMYGTGTGLWPTDDPPWYGSTIRNSIRKIVIEEGVTSIGAFAFMDCTSVKEVAPFPSTINTIDYCAFCNCGYDTLELHFTGSKPSFGDDVFSETTVKCYYNKNDSSWIGMGNYGADSIEWIGEGGSSNPPVFTKTFEGFTAEVGKTKQLVGPSFSNYDDSSTVTWCYREPGKNWEKCTDPPFSNRSMPQSGLCGIQFVATADMNGYQFFIRATNSVGSTDSNVATLTVIDTISPVPVFTKNLENTSAVEGDHKNLTANFSNYDDSSTVTWYVREPGGSWNESKYPFIDRGYPKGGYCELEFRVTNEMNGYQFYVRATNSAGSTDSNVATLTVSGTVSGWKQNSEGRWWYQRADGTYPKNQWEKIDGKWYYFESSGAMATGWKQLSGKWYYFESGGAMATGWKQLSGKWYYFESGGAMATGWKQLSGKWYYFEFGGAMATGWKQLSGKWYYFESGGAMATGWKQLSGKWYYFEISGVMLANTSRTIGSKTYTFDANGVCTNP